MKKIVLFFLILISIEGKYAAAQGYYQQYFDGADTGMYSLPLVIDTASSNIWQVGSPQKTIFDSASSLPNALVTDLMNAYPINNTSSFGFVLNNQMFVGFPIMALHWIQKLDMDHGYDGGIIEYSVDSGITWQNVINNPYVYNFYGYDSANVDTLLNGEYAFTGTDTSWKDIWLCFDYNFVMLHNIFEFRYTFKSDSVDTGKEGWMIDNFGAHVTIFHTIKEEKQKEYLRVYPNPTTGIVHIEAQKIDDFHIINSMELIDATGAVVEKFGVSPTKFWINLDKHKNGLYYLKISTNLKTEVHPVVLNKAARK
jgi:hypothetical protein